MRVWIEVTKDLLLFVAGRDPDDARIPSSVTISMAETMLPPQLEKPHVPAPPHPADTLSVLPLEAEQSATTPLVPVPARTAPLTEPERMFVCTTTTNCFQRPVRALDSVIQTFSYGDAVLVSRFEGRWAAVTRDGVSGWILKDVVTPHKESVFPQLQTGVVYDAQHYETIKLRACIKDEFAAEELLLPLESIEYVWFRLIQTGRVPNWPTKRPRVAGRWQQLLRGSKGVHIGITPVTHSAMEHLTEDGEGVIYFVESVKPDHSLEISGIDSRVPGRFTKEVVSKAVWQEWRPVFIQVI